MQLSKRAQEDAIRAILDILNIAESENLPILRKYQYHLLHWYVFEVPIYLEFESWKELGGLVSQQAKESFMLRINRLTGKA